MEEYKVVYIKVFDEERGDVVFEGKVSKDIAPNELVKLRCFWDRGLYGITNKASNEVVKSLKGFKNNVELVAVSGGDYKEFSGVLYISASDCVLRKSKRVPSCSCQVMSVWRLTHEECEKVLKDVTLEELEMSCCELSQLPIEIGKMNKLKKLFLFDMKELKSIPEEIGDLSSLEELQIWFCGVTCLPKSFKELKSISLVGLDGLNLQAEDLVLFSKLKRLRMKSFIEGFTPSFAQSFWEMIKSTTDLRFLELDWGDHDNELLIEALEENGSIVDGGKKSVYDEIFERNKSNHKRARDCAVYMLAIRRWRNALNDVPKEMVKMIAMMLWDTRCDVGAWSKK